MTLSNPPRVPMHDISHTSPDPLAAIVTVAVILTCFNRKQHTIDCLTALTATIDTERMQVSAILVDDGSTDGTAEAIRDRFAWVQVEHDKGNLFWCRGMHKGYALALQGDHDFYLWLNDDTLLHPDALTRLLTCESVLRAQQGKPVIVVGSTSDPASGAITYGGERRASALRRMRFLRIMPTEQPQRCDSMTGNIVFMSRNAARLVGNLDPAFEHAMGDTDYALRAQQRGVEVWVGPGVFGTCAANPPVGTYRDSSLALSRRWQLMMSRKGLPWRSWLRLTRRHAGPMWPLYFGWPYLRLLISHYLHRHRP